MSQGDCPESTQGDTIAEKEQLAVVLTTEDDGEVKGRLLPYPLLRSLNSPSVEPKVFKLSELISKLFKRLMKRQQQIDAGTFVKPSGPGRKRKAEYLSTDDLVDLVRDYLFDVLAKVCRRKSKRPDAIVSAFMRLIKKLPHFLIHKCSSPSAYKKTDMECYISSFLESYIPFSTFIRDE